MPIFGAIKNDEELGVIDTSISGALAGTSGTPGPTNEFVTNNDSRNTDARPPLTHVHFESDIVNLVTDLGNKVPTTRTINGQALSQDIIITASSAEIVSSCKIPTVDQIIAANYSAIVVRTFTLTEGRKLTIGLGSNFRIL